MSTLRLAKMKAPSMNLIANLVNIEDIKPNEQQSIREAL